MKVGIPKEIYPRERRVAATPETVAKLRTLGLEVVVQSGAGDASGFADAAYAEAGAQIVPAAGALFAASDMVLKVRPPEPAEVDALKPGTVLVGFVWPAQNKALVGAAGGAQGDRDRDGRDSPHLARAEDGRAVVDGEHRRLSRGRRGGESSSVGSSTGQMTAAGRVKPAQVLVIGAGVAGLAAIGAARGLGAIVRAFDTRPPSKSKSRAWAPTSSSSTSRKKARARAAMPRR